MTRIFFAALLAVATSDRLAADDTPKVDPRYSFRTDSANAHLPWHRPLPGEFPQTPSAHRIDGELVATDFVHRTGQFRTAETGELMDFTLPPYGVVRQLNADADLRDVPLGSFCRFLLHPDGLGNFSRLAVLQDQFSADAAEGVKYRLDEIMPETGTLLATRHAVNSLDRAKFLVTDNTRIWKSSKPAQLVDLAVGDELLVNLTGVTKTGPGHCTDVWAGPDTHQQATEQREQASSAFLKARGLAGWIDRTEGRTLAITLFGGDRAAFERSWLKNFAVGRTAHVVVSNDELRTWNPPVDHERGKIIEVIRDPSDGYGRSGLRIRVTVNFMLEGFRKGRVVRVFADGWPVKDQPFGEQLFHYGARSFPSELMEIPPKEYPSQFPFRTDFGNDHLPWYRLKPKMIPPQYSEHLVFGELLSADALRRTGRFRADRTGKIVDFSMTPEGSTRYLNVESDLSVLPIGTRCRFSMYLDEGDSFTRASLITDEASNLINNGAMWRVEALKLEVGKLHVARQPPAVTNDQGDPEQPPDIGRSELRIGPETRIWKSDRQVSARELVVGDLLLANVTGEWRGHPSFCTDIWVGVATHKLVIERQSRKVMAPKR